MSSQEDRPRDPARVERAQAAEPEGAPRPAGPAIPSEQKPQPQSAPVAADPDRLSTAKQPEPMGAPAPAPGETAVPEERPEPMGAPERRAD